MDDQQSDLLKECQDEVAELKAENEVLRLSAETFGQLAERLNQSALSERRASADRRHEDRGTPDRRREPWLSR
jgi:hypothetical protein